MKKLIKVFLILIMLLMICGVSFAEEIQPRDSINLDVVTDEETDNINDEIEEIETTSVTEDELEDFSTTNSNIIEGDIYKIENQPITIKDNVNGNIYVIGKELKLDGAVVNGNVFAVVDKADFSNTEINGTLYIVASEFNFSGSVNDVYVVGSKINIEDGAYIWRDMKASGDEITIDGNIYRNFDYISDKEATILENAKIGKTNYCKSEDYKSFFSRGTVVDVLLSAANTAILTLVIALILIYVKKTINKENDLLKNAAKGLGVLILVPIVSVVLLITFIASTLGLITLLLYILLLFVATSFGAFEIASKIADENKKIIGLSVLIALAAWGISYIPVIGVIIKLGVILIGLGSVVPAIRRK